jgi:hypothetical protein
MAGEPIGLKQNAADGEGMQRCDEVAQRHVTLHHVTQRLSLHTRYLHTSNHVHIICA